MWQIMPPLAVQVGRLNTYRDELRHKIQRGERVTKMDLKRACIDKSIMNVRDANELAKACRKINEFADAGHDNEDVHVLKGAMIRSMEFSLN